jgi:hypothetical protein
MVLQEEPAKQIFKGEKLKSRAECEPNELCGNVLQRTDALHQLFKILSLREYPA